MSHIHLKIQTILGQLEVDLWNWDSFQRDYVATRCRLTLLTLSTPQRGRLQPLRYAKSPLIIERQAGIIVINEARWQALCAVAGRPCACSVERTGGPRRLHLWLTLQGALRV